MADIIQLRRDTAANWVTANPVLHDGEIGIETDTRKRKCGNGTTAWNSLPYMYSDDVDSEPTANSHKPVESGGTKAAIDIAAEIGLAALDAIGDADTVPTEESTELVRSGGVWEAIRNNGKGAFDISAYKAVGGVLAKFDDLAQALGTNGANVPAAARKPGMSVCFVLNSDNKYVRYNYLKSSTTDADIANVANWQGVDEDSVEGSHNLVESGSVAAVRDTVKNFIGYEPIHTNRKVYVGTPSQSQWFIGPARHILIPVTVGGKYYLKAVSSSTMGRYCFLSSEHAEPVASQDVVKYATGTSQVDIYVNTITQVTVPEGAAYLCLTIVNGNGTSILWEVARFVESPSILIPVNERIDGLSEKTDEEYKELREIAVGDVGDIEIDGVELGTIATDGTVYSSNEISMTGAFYYADKYYSDYVKISGNLAKAREVIGNSVSTINVNVHCYNKNKTSIGRTSKGYQHVETNAVEYPLRDNTYYIKLTISFSDSNNQNINISSYISAISSAINDILSIEKPVLSLQKQIDSNRSAISSFDDELVDINNKIDGEPFLVDLPDFEMGTIAEDGTPYSSTTICHSITFIDIKNYTYCIAEAVFDVVKAIVSDATRVNFNVVCYDSSKACLGRVGYKLITDTEQKFIYKENTRYVKFLFDLGGSTFGSYISSINEQKGSIFTITSYMQNSLKKDIESVSSEVDDIHRTIVDKVGENKDSFVITDNSDNPVLIADPDGVRVSNITDMNGDPIGNNGDINYLNLDIEGAVSGIGSTLAWELNKPKKFFTFIHFSDIHGDEERTKRLIRYANTHANIDAVIFTGDIFVDNYKDQGYTNTFGKHYSECTKPLLLALGNHDSAIPSYNTSIDKSTETTHQELVDMIIAPCVQAIGATPTGKGYYYKDFPTYKIRIIVLDEYELPHLVDASNNTYIVDPWKRYISQGQADWLCNTLGSVPAGYSVIFAFHQVIDNVTGITGEFTTTLLRNGYDREQSQIIQDIVDAYISREILTATYAPLSGNENIPSVTVNADFTNSNGTFVCYLNGHCHYDSIGTSSLAQETQLNINIVSDMLTNPGGDFFRKVGTKHEDCFNVVAINTDERKVRIVRVGANKTIDMRRREMISINY